MILEIGGPRSRNVLKLVSWPCQVVVSALVRRSTMKVRRETLPQTTTSSGPGDDVISIPSSAELRDCVDLLVDSRTFSIQKCKSNINISSANSKR